MRARNYAGRKDRFPAFPAEGEEPYYSRMVKPRRRIMSVGFVYPDEDAESIDFLSDRSLLDADVVVFQPELPVGYGHSYESFQGKPLLTESASFAAKEAASRWRSELLAAIGDGKTILVYLVRPAELFVHTGRKEYSGTGRNQKTTNIVEPFSVYSALPIEIERVVPKGGEEIRVVGDLGALKEYWSEYGSDSPFRAYLEAPKLKTILSTRTGNKTVGAVARGAKGVMYLLPPLNYEWSQIYEEADDDIVLTKAGKVFGKRLTEILLALDQSENRNVEVRAPVWALGSAYRFPAESQVETQIQTLTAEIEARTQERVSLARRLDDEGRLRRLLYAKGRALEEAVIEALRLLGFAAEGVTEKDSEFDVIFESTEGRFLGEVEGKDTKPVNIDKLSQLERNIQEDYSRESVSDYAKGVLFANVYMTIDPTRRTGEFFTEKCVSGAKRSGLALVRTPDLFVAARALKLGADAEFARQCRAAIASTVGELVTFPSWSEVSITTDLSTGTS